MRVIKHDKIRLSKLLLLAVMLLAVMAGLTTSGCVRGLNPVGWSGGVVADGTIFLGSMEGRLAPPPMKKHSQSHRSSLPLSALTTGGCHQPN